MSQRSKALFSGSSVAIAVAMLMGVTGGQLVAAQAAVPTVVGTTSFSLIAGQTTDAGYVTVAVSGDALVVTMTTVGDWIIDEAHVWVGSSLVTLPKAKNGNPIPGRFPYAASDVNDQTVSFTIPLASLGFACPSGDVTYLLAAHASVSRAGSDGSEQQETAWSDGARFVTKGNWGTYSAFTLGCIVPPVTPEPEACETAFAYSPLHSTTFLDLLGTNTRWGWTNGPLSEGQYAFQLWAGAGQNDLSKGALAGSVTLSYEGGMADIGFGTVDGWSLKETHVYVGALSLPLKNGNPTTAPGQYGNIHEDLGGATADAYEIGASGPVYLVAHAPVCR